MTTRRRGGPGASEIERTVLGRCRAQDPLAFRAFVAHYKATVFAVLGRIVGGSTSSVDDLAQETFLRAFRAFPRFDVDAEARASTWLLTIAVRLALNEKRRTGLAGRSTEPLDSSNDLADAMTPEAALGNTELGDAIQVAADALPEEQRAVFVLVELHGYSMAEVATMVGAAEATVKTRLFRARARLREGLRPWINGAPEGDGP